MESFYKFSIEQYGDERGMLTSLETGKNIPFEIARTYYLSNLKKDKKRACHAHKDSQRVLNAIAGGCKVTLYDGEKKETFALQKSNECVYFNKGTWCELSDFEEDTIILALSDKPYYESEYIRNYEDFLKFKEDNAQ